MTINSVINNYDVSNSIDFEFSYLIQGDNMNMFQNILIVLVQLIRKLLLIININLQQSYINGNHHRTFHKESFQRVSADFKLHNYQCGIYHPSSYCILVPLLFGYLPFLSRCPVQFKGIPFVT